VKDGRGEEFAHLLSQQREQKRCHWLKRRTNKTAANRLHTNSSRWQRVKGLENIILKRTVSLFIFVVVFWLATTGCCKSPVRFEKRVYLSKPALSLLKTGFSREKPAKMSSKPGL
jgi:hypothetical protein